MRVAKVWVVRSLVGVVALIPAATWAQGEAQKASVLDGIQSCRSIAAAADRLACYDKAAAALQTARSNDGLIVMDRADVREKRRKLFGFQLPDINLFGGKNDGAEERVTEITSTVRAARPSGRDRWVVTLEDGSVWRTLEPSKFDPRPRDTARVKAAALGSYRANFAGYTAVRVERVQ